MPTVGALPMIAGSFSVTLLSTLFALPIAFGSAIFVVEVAPRFGRRVFQPLRSWWASRRWFTALSA